MGLEGGFLTEGESRLKGFFDRGDMTIVEVEAIGMTGLEGFQARELSGGDSKQESLNSGVGNGNVFHRMGRLGGEISGKI